MTSFALFTFQSTSDKQLFTIASEDAGFWSWGMILVSSLVAPYAFVQLIWSLFYIKDIGKSIKAFLYFVLPSFAVFFWAFTSIQFTTALTIATLVIGGVSAFFGWALLETEEEREKWEEDSRETRKMEKEMWREKMEEERDNE